MKTKIDWRNHLIELLVVFIGITAAFMLNNWREGQKDRELERKHIRSLVEDITLDSLELHAVLQSNEWKASRLLRFIEHSKKQNPTSDSAVAVLGELLSNHQFAPKAITYESMKNSGTLNLISDYELKERLISYYSGFADLKFKENVLNDYLNSYVIPFVYKNMDLMRQSIHSPRALEGFEFRNLVVGYYTLLLQNVESYNSAAERNVTLKESLVVRAK